MSISNLASGREVMARFIWSHQSRNPAKLLWRELRGVTGTVEAAAARSPTRGKVFFFIWQKSFIQVCFFQWMLAVPHYEEEDLNSCCYDPEFTSQHFVLENVFSQFCILLFPPYKSIEKGFDR